MKLKHRVHEWLADHIKGVQYPQHRPVQRNRYTHPQIKKPDFADYVFTGIAILMLLAIGIGAITIGCVVLLAIAS